MSIISVLPNARCTVWRTRPRCILQTLLQGLQKDRETFSSLFENQFKIVPYLKDTMPCQKTHLGSKLVAQFCVSLSPSTLSFLRAHAAQSSTKLLSLVVPHGIQLITIGSQQGTITAWTGAKVKTSRSKVTALALLPEL